MLKRHDKLWILSVSYLFSLAMFNAMTGMFMLIAGGRYDSVIYDKIEELIPLEILGLLLFSSAIFLLISIFVKGYPEISLMIAGGLLGAIGLGLYASASSVGVDNLLVPSRYALLSISNLSIMVTGGLTLWQKRKKTM